MALFNRAWSLLDTPQRSESQDLDLIHCAHASRWHWGRAGGPQEWAVGAWQRYRARELAAALPDPADRAVVEGDLATLPPL